MTGNPTNIHRETPTTLHCVNETYATIPSKTIDLISNPAALAIVVYLGDRPIDWKVRRRDVMKKFGLGRDRYDKALRHLRDLGLCWTEYDRDAKGMIKNTRICISTKPRPDIRKPAIRSVQQSGEHGMSDNPATYT